MSKCKVWIVLEQDFAEFQECHGAFSSEEAANRFIGAQVASRDRYPNEGGFWVEVHEVKS